MALGLGPMQLRSRLGQPLEAIVPVHGVTAGDASFVSAFVADPTDFERLGAKRTVVTRVLRLDTVTDGDTVAIRVSSLQPIREPELDLVVEVAYRRSRLVHRYRVTLPDDGSTATAPARAPADAPAAPPGSATPIEVYGPVRATDTLWSLARRLRPTPDITIEQMMVAVVRANPRAFADGRFDGLRRGAYLRIPRQTVILRTAPDAAREAVGDGRLAAP